MKVLLRAVRLACLALAGATTAQAACSLEKVTEMPLLSLGAHYAVMVGIEDVVRPMVVDTGAETTLIKASVVRELSLKPDETMEVARPVVGIGQTSGDVQPNAVPSKLAFGDLVFHDRSTTVAAMDDGQTPESNSIGLLGDDILSKYDVEFDFPSHRLAFYREIACYDTFVPWAGVFATIPFEHRGAKILVDIMLNQERTQAIVDTGNNMSFISKNASALWGAAESDLSLTKGKLQVPFNQAAALVVRAYPFFKVTIGGDVFIGKKMNVVDVNFPQASANLGLDYWSSRKIWISYPHEWMFIANDPMRAKLVYPVNAAPPQQPAPRAGPVAETDGPN